MSKEIALKQVFYQHQIDFLLDSEISVYDLVYSIIGAIFNHIESMSTKTHKYYRMLPIKDRYYIQKLFGNFIVENTKKFGDKFIIQASNQTAFNVITNVPKKYIDEIWKNIPNVQKISLTDASEGEIVSFTDTLVMNYTASDGKISEALSRIKEFVYVNEEFDANTIQYFQYKSIVDNFNKEKFEGMCINHAGKNIRFKVLADINKLPYIDNVNTDNITINYTISKKTFHKDTYEIIFGAPLIDIDMKALFDIIKSSAPCDMKFRDLKKSKTISKLDVKLYIINDKALMNKLMYDCTKIQENMIQVPKSFAKYVEETIEMYKKSKEEENLEKEEEGWELISK